MYSLLYYRYALMYSLCVALVSIYRQYLMKDIPPIFILCVSSAISMVYFHLINFSEIQTMYQKILREKKLFFILNVVVAMIWICAFYSIFFSSATLYTYEYFLFGACMSLFFTKYKLKSLLFLGAHVFLIIIPCFLFPNDMKGIILGMIAGCLGYIYNHLSSEIYRKLSLTSTQILASRFWLLFVVSLFWVNNLPAFTISQFQLWNVLGMAFLSFIFQIWLNQQSIFTVGSKKTSYICGLVPMITYLCQGFLLHQWTISVFFLSVSASLLIAFVLMLQRENA